MDYARCLPRPEKRNHRLSAVIPARGSRTAAAKVAPLAGFPDRPRFACPCCGYVTLPEQPPGTFEICPVCWWEDDKIQFDDPEHQGGANRPSLTEARATYLKVKASERRFMTQVRPPRIDVTCRPRSVSGGAVPTSPSSQRQRR